MDCVSYVFSKFFNHAGPNSFYQPGRLETLRDPFDTDDEKPLLFVETRAVAPLLD